MLAIAIVYIVTIVLMEYVEIEDLGLSTARTPVFLCTCTAHVQM